MSTRTISLFLTCIMLTIFTGVFQGIADTEENKALILRATEEIWNQGDLSVVDEIYAADYIRYDPASPGISGTADLKQLVAMYRAAWPDLNFTVEDLIAEGDMVAGRWACTGTHTGDLMIDPSIPATGVEGTLTGISIYYISDGKIAKEWAEWDAMGMMEQVGAVFPTREDYSWGAPSEVTGDPGDPKKNEAVVLRWIDDLCNAGNLAVADEIFASDFVHHDPVLPDVTDLAGYKEHIAEVLAAFPDQHTSLRNIFAEEDKVVLRYTWSGTQTGDLPGMPASGKYAEMSAIIIFRFVDGKIQETWLAKDFLGLMQQIGPTQEERNKVFLVSYFDALSGKEKPAEVVNQYVAESDEDLRQHIALFEAAFPLYELRVNDMIAEGDKVAVRTTFHGTHQGELMGIPPTGVEPVVAINLIYRIAHNKIVEHWMEADQLGLMQQLGVIDPMGREDFSWGTPSEVTGDPGDPETNKAIVMRYTEEVFNQQNVDLIDELMITDVVNHSSIENVYPALGIESHRRAINDYLTAYPDFHATIDDIIAEGDKVVDRWTATGTHLGELMGMHPTGHQITFTGITIFRFADGMIVETWWGMDVLGMMEQITAAAELQANKTLVTRHLENVCNLEAVDEFCAADYVWHGPDDDGDLESLKQILAKQCAMFPDWHYAIDDMIAEGEEVVQRVTTTGTYQITGMPITVTANRISRIADGKIAEEWWVPDTLGFMQQLGLADPMGRQDYTWGTPSEVTGDPGDPETSKTIALRYTEEVFNQQNVDLIDELMITDVVNHSSIENIYPALGIESHRQAINDYLTAYPDFHATVHNVIAEGDKVVTHWTVTGTHEGELMGMHPTGCQVTFTGITILRFADGKIAELWWAMDVMGMMQQIAAAAELEANKALAHRFHMDLFQEGNLDAADEIIASDFVIHFEALPPEMRHGIEGAKLYAIAIRTGLPDVSITHDAFIAEGDKVAIRWISSATHTGDLFGIPATGQHVDATGIDIFRIENGKIAELWQNWDQLGLMQQIGAITPGRENYTWGVPSEVTGDPGDPQENKAIVQRMIDGVITGDLTVVDEIFAADYVMHDPAWPAEVSGPEGFKQWAGAMGEPFFSDSSMAVEDMMAEGDKVVVLWTWNATHAGEFMNIPPTGRRMRVTGISIHRLADSKFVESWVSYDMLGMMQTLTMSQEEYSKALDRRILEEIWNEGNLGLIADTYAPNYVFHIAGQPDVQGLDGVRQFVTMYLTAFPDLHFTIEDQIAEGDMVVSRWTSTGTSTGELMGIPPTGEKGTTVGIIIRHIVGGKSVEEWSVSDDLGMLQQLGVVPPDREDYTWSAPSEVTGDPGDPETNKAIVHRLIDEFCNQGNLDLADEIFASEFLLHDPAKPAVRGTEGYKQLFAMYLAAFPDIQFAVEHMLAEGDRVAVRWSATGTHKGEFMDVPPSNVQITVTGIAIHRFADGKIQEFWESYDALGLMQQLGIIPSMEPKDYSNIFYMPLSPGLNMISLPVEPETPYTARSLAEKLSATMVMKYDETLGGFVAFIPVAPDDGFAIEGGKGYIVNVPEGGMVAFVGAAWTRPPMPAAAPTQGDNVWAFVVSGSVLDGEGMSPRDEDYTVTVKNLRTGATDTEIAHSSGYFAAAYADLSRKAVVEAGDKVEVAVTDSRGDLVSGPHVYDITLDELRNAVVRVQLRLGDIIPEKPALLQNYPNPFNPETWIPYHLNVEAPVSISIYSVNGQLVRALDLGHKDAGVYVSRSKAAYWDGRNEAGEAVTSGIYFYTITAGDFSATRKMIVRR